MIPFVPSDPFPLITNPPYQEEQEHAEKVDHWLGLNIGDVEELLAQKGCRSRARGSLREEQNLWIGLAVKSLLTPYTETRSMLEYLKPEKGSTVIDLGAGYGRMGFVIGRHFPGVHFVGYEYVGERVKEGRRCISNFHYDGIKLEHVDLSTPDFSPLPAEYYFIYDFGSTKAIEKTLHDLRRIALKRPITVVGRGRHCRDLIERRHPWLSAVAIPEHRGINSVYRTVFG